MMVKRLSGSSPDGTLQKVVIVEILGCHQFCQRRLSPAYTLGQPEVFEARNPWRLNDQEIGGMTGDGSKGMGHIGRDHFRER
jgi:hypothetical protein